MRRPAPDDVRTAYQVVAAVTCARRVLATGGLPAALRHYGLSPVTSGTAGAGAAVDVPLPPRLRRRVRLAHRLMRLPGLKTTCLPGSLVVADLLRAEGCTPDVVIGVKADGRFCAHAWVEAGSWRLDGSGLPAADYREIARLRGSG